MSEKIRILSPEWTTGNHTYLDHVMDRDQLIEAMQTASQLPKPFDCDLFVNGITVDSKVGVASLLNDLGILDEVYESTSGDPVLMLEAFNRHNAG